MFRQIHAGVIVLALLLTACGEATQEKETDATNNVELETSLNAASDRVSSVELIPLSFREWETRRDGFAPKILVVDLWATWCPPCLEKFPHMVEMHRKYQDRGVQVVTLSLDDRDDPASVEFAKEFLVSQNATFPNFFLDENIMDAFEMVGIQTVPAIHIYDRNGNLVADLNDDNPNNQFSDEDVEKAILALLDES
ncbi:MAG: TlpA disulfide reductase family protein [Pseudomonadota bacterium]